MVARMLAAILLGSVLVAEAAQRDSSWTIRLVPANDYEGVVEVVAIFKDGKQNAVVLPSSKLVKGKLSTFPASLMSAGPLQMVFVRTRGVCPIGVLPLKVLRLRLVQLISNDAHTTYSKLVNDLAVKDLCQNNKTLGTGLRDLDEITQTYCVVNGEKHENGKMFAMGCRARCVCRNGNLGCTSMCPPVGFSPKRKCHSVHAPGECCTVPRCEDEQEMNNCNAPIAATVKTEKGLQPPLHRYPWAVWICVDDKCSQNYGGIIIGKSHILTFAPDLSTFKNLRFIAGLYIAGNNASDFSPLKIVNVTAHPDFVNTNSPIADSAARVQLLQVDQPFTVDKVVQPANLPLNEKQCEKFASGSCPLMTVGWDLTDPEDRRNPNRQWFLHAAQSNLNESACKQPTPQNTTNNHPTSKDSESTHARGRRDAGIQFRGQPRVCLSGLIRKDCTGPRGGAVIASAGSADFICGILDPDRDLLPCANPGTAGMLPLCKYMKWISTTTASI